MLEFLHGRATDRKLRLFAAACCRRVWDLLADPRSRAAVEVVERRVDGEADAREMRSADRMSLRAARWANLLGWPHREAAQAVRALTAIDALNPPEHVARYAQGVTAGSVGEKAHRVTQAVLLRDVFGNPFRPPPPIDPAWLAWNDRLAVRMANAIYEERQLPSGHLDPHRLAVLADALEDAGCADEDILSHLRGPGPHVRGCFVIDALLAKS